MIDWIAEWIESLGYAGVFGLMVLEHVIPPIPSEVIMPLSGFVSSQSVNMSLGTVILAGSVGSLVGTLPWYVLGKMASYKQIVGLVERYGRWLTLTPKDVHKARDFFQQQGGGWVVGLGRVVPGSGLAIAFLFWGYLLTASHPLASSPIGTSAVVSQVGSELVKYPG